jgi:hypothetical protein
MYGAKVWQIPTREINKMLSIEMGVLRRSARKSRVERMFVKLSCVYVSFKVFAFIVVSWIVCRVIADLCILWSIYVYSLSVYLW